MSDYFSWQAKKNRDRSKVIADVADTDVIQVPEEFKQQSSNIDHSGMIVEECEASTTVINRILNYWKK